MSMYNSVGVVYGFLHLSRPTLDLNRVLKLIGVLEKYQPEAVPEFISDLGVDPRTDPDAVTDGGIDDAVAFMFSLTRGAVKSCYYDNYSGTMYWIDGGWFKGGGDPMSGDSYIGPNAAPLALGEVEALGNKQLNPADREYLEALADALGDEPKWLLFDGWS